jgi:hypothetical protein
MQTDLLSMNSFARVLLISILAVGVPTAYLSYVAIELDLPVWAKLISVAPKAALSSGLFAGLFFGYLRWAARRLR